MKLQYSTENMLLKMINQHYDSAIMLIKEEIYFDRELSAAETAMSWTSVRIRAVSYGFERSGTPHL